MQYNADGCTKFEIKELNLYRKKNIDINFIESLDIADEGEDIIIPTLEGKVTIAASTEQYIMIGPCNDIYPIPRKLFDERYDVIEGSFSGEIWEPFLAKNTKNIKRCHLKKEVFVYAIEVPFDFKVYVKHCNSIIYGNSGDFYAVSYEDTGNAYIIRKSVMVKTYELVERI